GSRHRADGTRLALPGARVCRPPLPAFVLTLRDQVKLSRRRVRSQQHLGHVVHGNDSAAPHQHSRQQGRAMRERLQIVRPRQFRHHLCRQRKALLPQREEHVRSFWRCGHTADTPRSRSSPARRTSRSLLLKTESGWTPGTTPPPTTASPRYQLRSSCVNAPGKAWRAEISTMRSVESTNSAAGESLRISTRPEGDCGKCK